MLQLTPRSSLSGGYPLPPFRFRGPLPPALCSRRLLQADAAHFPVFVRFTLAADFALLFPESCASDLANFFGSLCATRRTNNKEYTETQKPRFTGITATAAQSILFIKRDALRVVRFHLFSRLAQRHFMFKYWEFQEVAA